MPERVLFLIDRSGSAAGQSSMGVAKALGVADMLDRLLWGLVARSTDTADW